MCVYRGVGRLAQFMDMEVIIGVLPVPLDSKPC